MSDQNNKYSMAELMEHVKQLARTLGYSFPAASKNRIELKNRSNATSTPIVVASQAPIWTGNQSVKHNVSNYINVSNYANQYNNYFPIDTNPLPPRPMNRKEWDKYFSPLSSPSEMVEFQTPTEYAQLRMGATLYPITYTSGISNDYFNYDPNLQKMACHKWYIHHKHVFVIHPTLPSSIRSDKNYNFVKFAEDVTRFRGREAYAALLPQGPVFEGKHNYVGFIFFRTDLIPYNGR
jgi:hypothetical protein